MRAFLALLFIALGQMTASARADVIRLYAAGSLRAALTEIAQAFGTESGNTVQLKFGPSGLLKDEIGGGAAADVFASANMEHPQALHAMAKSGPVRMFARNKLCALVRPGLATDSASLLAAMLDPAVKLGISTPKSDPSGDYAFEVFRKAEIIRPGAQAALEKKALQLMERTDSPQPPEGETIYGWNVATGRADIFLAYCTATRDAAKQHPEQRIVELPDALSVGADYGLTVITGAPPAATQFAEFILGEPAQRIFGRYGFEPPTQSR